MSGDLLLGAFVLGEYLAGALDDLIRQACQLGDFNSVAAVGGAGLHFSEEHDAAASLLDGDMVILHAGEPLGEFGQLKIMSGEQSLGAGARVDIFDRGPGDGKTVVGGGAAADFIERS